MLYFPTNHLLSRELRCVSDTRIGIPREEIPYLFKKFSRGKDVSRLHVGGTGLGLYVGKAIAEAHHGQALKWNKFTTG